MGTSPMLYNADTTPIAISTGETIRIPDNAILLRYYNSQLVQTPTPFTADGDTEVYIGGTQSATEVGQSFVYTIETAVTIPNNCVLKFEGGSLRNGTLQGNGTKIDNSGNSAIFNNIRFQGSLLTDKIYVNWFGAIGDGTYDSTKEIQECIDALTGIDRKFRQSKTILFTDNEYLISDTIHIHRELSYCALMGSMSVSLDGGVKITSINCSVPIIRLYTVGSTIHNLRLSYPADLVDDDNENKVCLLFKATDDEDTTDYRYSDVDASIYDCAFSYCHIGINYWGIQMDCHNNLFTGMQHSAIKVDCFPNGGREDSGPARCYKIYRNNFHAMNANSYIVYNNTGEYGYNFHVTENFSDSFALLFYGNIIKTLIANNNLSLCREGKVIDSSIIVDSVINNNILNRREDYPYGQYPRNYIRANEITKSTISDNFFGESQSSALSFDQSTSLIITGNTFNRIQG